MSAASEAITVLGTSRYYAEALALSLSAHTEQHVFALTELETSALARSSIVLVEIGKDLQDTIELIRRTAARRPGAPIVVLGSIESEENIAKLAHAGASGYVHANASFHEMLSIVLTARKGEFSCAPDITFVLFARLAELAQDQAAAEKVVPMSALTIRERQVLALVARGFSNKEIADSLSISVITVKNHVHRLLTKMRIRDRRIAARLPQLAKTIP
jgi:two-component system nitrate/nitrite response regulator NarL